MDVARSPGPRQKCHRFRGPRSSAALQRRCRAQFHERNSSSNISLPPGGGTSEAVPAPPVNPTFATDCTTDFRTRVLHVNIRGWLSHFVELEAHVCLLPYKPMIIFVNETFLDESVESITFDGYEVICRHDRADGRRGGGILVLATTLFAPCLTLLEKSNCAERC